jgi:alkylhydroperoxidase/carboxymuconolactone decarboxylase family protein YurZ
MMGTGDNKDAVDLNPEAVLARAMRARGDVFPEWKAVAYAIPKTYHLINETGSYLHQYHGQAGGADKLSAQMRELIAIPALCAKGDMRHTPNHIRRCYRMGMTDRILFEAATAYASVAGWAATILQVSLAITEANSADYPFGELPLGGAPTELTPFPELTMGRTRKGSHSDSLADTPDWRYAAAIDPELAKRAATFIDHCLLNGGAGDELLGPGPRELIVIAALCTRGEAELAADHIRRAYDYGMSKKNVLEAICCVIPMTGMITAQIGLRAMQRADGAVR